MSRHFDFLPYQNYNKILYKFILLQDDGWKDIFWSICSYLDMCLHYLFRPTNHHENMPI